MIRGIEAATSMKRCFLFVVLLLAAAPVFEAVQVRVGSKVSAKAESKLVLSVNPIRRVVTMLETMYDEFKNEKAEATLDYEDVYCQCKETRRRLTAAIEAASLRIPEDTAQLKSDNARYFELGEDLKQTKADQFATEESKKETLALRVKAHDEYIASRDALTGDLEAVKAAQRAIETGIASSFTQTRTAQTVINLVQDKDMFDGMADEDRDNVVQFIQSGASGQAPEPSVMIGILKQMAEDMTKDRTALEEKEDQELKDHVAIMKTKEEQIRALKDARMTKMERYAAMAPEIEFLKKTLEATKVQKMKDEDYLFENDQGCARKAKENEKAQASFQSGLDAISTAIRILNADPALDLFKKSLVGEEGDTSFLQLQRMQMTSEMKRRRALDIVRKANSPHFDMIQLALKYGKTKEEYEQGFQEVVKMIDVMEKVLETEQRDDNRKKDHCTRTMSKHESDSNLFTIDLRNLEGSIKDEDIEIGRGKDALEEVSEKIEWATGKLKELTAERKKENALFKESTANAQASREIIVTAKMKLAKHFNPKLYNAAYGIALTQTNHSQPMKEEKWSEDPRSYRVNKVLDRLTKRLEINLEIFQTNEDKALKDYKAEYGVVEEMLRSYYVYQQESKSALASDEVQMEELVEANNSKTKELEMVTKAIAELHESCDWLINNYDVRMRARSGEVAALKNAKLVLQGFDANNEVQ